MHYLKMIYLIHIMNRRDVKMKIKVGVIYGGETVEHEVSIISAIQAINKIDQEKYDIIPIYITKDREWYTGDMLKDIEVYSDLSLIKKYGKNVVLYEKDGSFILQNKKFPKNVITDIDIAFPIMQFDFFYHIFSSLIYGILVLCVLLFYGLI